MQTTHDILDTNTANKKEQKLTALCKLGNITHPV